MQEEMGCETFDLENGARNQQTFTNLHFPITKIVRYLCCFPLSFKISKCHLRQSWSSLNNAPHKAHGCLVRLAMPTHISRCSNAYNSKAQQIVEMHPREKKSEMLNGKEEKKIANKIKCIRMPSSNDSVHKQQIVSDQTNIKWRDISLLHHDLPSLYVPVPPFFEKRHVAFTFSQNIIFPWWAARARYVCISISISASASAQSEPKNSS